MNATIRASFDQNLKIFKISFFPPIDHCALMAFGHLCSIFHCITCFVLTTRDAISNANSFCALQYPIDHWVCILNSLLQEKGSFYLTTIAQFQLNWMRNLGQIKLFGWFYDINFQSLGKTNDSIQTNIPPKKHHFRDIRLVLKLQSISHIWY